MSQVLGWTIVVAFIATTAVTLLGLVGIAKIPESYLRRLFVALILEIVASGFFLFRLGLSPEQAYFREASSIFNQAVIARQNKDFEAADRLLGQVLAISPKGVPFEVRQVFRERGEMAFDKTLWESAVQSYGVYSELQQPDELGVLLHYGRALRETDRYELALKIYEQAERLSPNNYDVLNGLQNITRRLGAFYLDADRIDVAEPYFQRTRDYVTRMIALAPDKTKDSKRYKNAISARARLYWEWRRYPEAIAALQQAISEYPDLVQAQEDLAAVLIESGERAKDQSQLRRARDLYQTLYTQKPAGYDGVYDGAGFAEAATLTSDTTPAMLAEAQQAVLLSIAERDKAAEDPYPFYAAAILYKRIGQAEQASKHLQCAIRYERLRAGDKYKFDYVRAIKYETLLRQWQVGQPPSNTLSCKGT